MATSNINDIVRTVPELSTRPALVALIQRWNNFRGFILSTHDVMWQIAFIPDPPVAVQILDLYWRHTQLRYGTIWRPRLLDCTETIHEGHVLCAECHGALRNIYRNVGASLGRTQWFNWSRHDVIRKIAA